MKISDSMYNDIERRIDFYKEHKKNTFEDVFYHSHLNTMMDAISYVKNGIPIELKELIKVSLTKELEKVRLNYNKERFSEIQELIEWADLTDDLEEPVNKILAINNPDYNPKEGEEYKVVYGFVVKSFTGDNSTLSVFRPGHTAVVCKVSKEECNKCNGYFEEGSLVFKFSIRGEPLFKVDDAEYICNLDTAHPKQHITLR